VNPVSIQWVKEAFPPR